MTLGFIFQYDVHVGFELFPSKGLLYEFGGHVADILVVLEQEDDPIGFILASFRGVYPLLNFNDGISDIILIDVAEKLVSLVVTAFEPIKKLIFELVIIFIEVIL
jgi:hypothetical protein